MLVLDIDDPRWVAFAARHPRALPFHQPAWARLLADCYRFRPLALALADGAGRVVAGLPLLEVGGRVGRRRWVSLPFTDYCPPLATEGHGGDLAAALVAEVAARRLGALEVRAALPERAGLYNRAAAVRHTTPLGPDPAAVYRIFGKMHQRNIRKAERAGVRVVLGRATADVRRFYGLHLLTRRRLGAPVQPRRFFDLLAARLLARDEGFVLTAYVDDAPAAAAVFLVGNGTLVYKYGASDARYWEHRPNNLLFREALRWGCEHGCHTFDWGRSDLEDEGLRQFKAGWGAREEALVYAVVAAAPPRPASGRLQRVLGAVIRRSSPWVCRAIGEGLYRYAA